MVKDHSINELSSVGPGDQGRLNPPVGFVNDCFSSTGVSFNIRFAVLVWSRSRRAETTIDLLLQVCGATGQSKEC
jgi:hypothetical protein